MTKRTTYTTVSVDELYNSFDWFEGGKIKSEINIEYLAIEFRVRLREFSAGNRSNKYYAFNGTVAALDPQTGNVLLSEKRKRVFFDKLKSEHVFNTDDILTEYIEFEKAAAKERFSDEHDVNSPDFEKEIEKTLRLTEANVQTRIHRHTEACNSIYISSTSAITSCVIRTIKKLYSENSDQLRVYMSNSYIRSEIKPYTVLDTFLDIFLNEKYGCDKNRDRKSKRYARQIRNLFAILDSRESMKNQKAIKPEQLKKVAAADICSARIFWNWGLENAYWEGVFPVEKVPVKKTSSQKHFTGRKAAELQSVLSNEEKHKLMSFILENPGIKTAVTVLVASNFSDKEIVGLTVGDTKIYDLEKVLIKVVKENLGPVQTYLRYTVPYLTPTLYKHIKALRSKHCDSDSDQLSAIPLFTFNNKRIDEKFITDSVRETLKCAGVAPRRYKNSTIEYKAIIKNTFKNDIEFNSGIDSDDGFKSILKGEVPESVTDSSYCGYNSSEGLTQAYRVLKEMGPPLPTNETVTETANTVEYHPEYTNQCVHLSGTITLSPGETAIFYTEGGASYLISK